MLVLEMQLYTIMRSLTSGMRSEECVVRRFRRLARWCSLLLLDYKPVQHVTVLNIVGNCNTMVSIIISV